MAQAVKDHNCKVLLTIFLGKWILANHNCQWQKFGHPAEPFSNRVRGTSKQRRVVNQFQKIGHRKGDCSHPDQDGYKTR